MPGQPSRDRLTAGVLTAYGLPGLPLAVLTLPVYIFLPAHYAALGLPLASIGWALLLARLWDGITDPLVGVLSDRTRSRFGRRRVWLAAGLPLTLLGAWFLLRPGEAPGLAHLVGWSFVLHLGWTMMIVPLSAWGAELSGDYHERTRIGAFRDAFVILGTVTALVLPVAAGAGGAGQEERALAVIAMFTLAVLPLTTILCLAMVPEAPPAPVPPLSMRRGIVVLLRNGPFRRLILAYVLNGVANGLPAQLFLFFVQYKLMEGEKAGPLLVAYFVAGLVAVPLWLGLSKRFGKHRVWSWAMLWACAWFAVVPFLGPGDFAAFLAVCVLTGAALGADLVLPSAMQADVVDADTARTGRSRAGLYFAFWGMATKLATALAALGLTAAGMFGFRVAEAGGSVVNTDTALFALTALYSLVPIIFKLAAVALLWRWPLTAAVQAELRRRIAARQAA